jgi:hypothetical protein
MAGTFGFTRDDDLTGLWSGEYRYPGNFRPTPFSAHLSEANSILTGTTLEPATFGAPGLTELSADIAGARTDLLVRFTKIYHPAPGVHRDPIYYSGTVDAKLTSIEGDWRFSSGFVGRFVLVRASRPAAAQATRTTASISTKR